MLLHIPDVLTQDEVAQCRRIVEAAAWEDGRVTAGYQAAGVKRNRQLTEDNPAARKAQEIVIAALERNAMFVSAALPAKLFPPMFNRYEGGEEFGNHIDTAIRQVAGTPHRVRSDLSATLFLMPPESYVGGELTIEDSFGVHSVKLPAGHMVLYPGSSLHHVRPVQSGVRLAAFFWIQSMVREDGQRSLLFDLDNSIQRLSRSFTSKDEGDRAALVRLTGVYHNLLRSWAEI